MPVDYYWQHDSLTPVGSYKIHTHAIHMVMTIFLTKLKYDTLESRSS